MRKTIAALATLALSTGLLLAGSTSAMANTRGEGHQPWRYSGSTYNFSNHYWWNYQRQRDDHRSCTSHGLVNAFNCGDLNLDLL